MRWSYKTIHYELKKEGLLGSVFLDESEIEESLNDYGRSGWELISMLETSDGIIAVFKQPLGDDYQPHRRPPIDDDEALVIAAPAVVSSSSEPDQVDEKENLEDRILTEQTVVMEDQSEITTEADYTAPDPEPTDSGEEQVPIVDVGTIRIE